MTRVLPGILFWGLVALTVAAHCALLWQSVAVTRLWEDEAFNLTVPLNLLRGLGYTSDGTLSGSQLTPFDPRISTGPVVLLPIAGVLALGADPVVGARLISAAFYLALLAALAVLGHRIGGRWAALVAVAVPLALNTAASISPIQGPADILGEIPAAALCAWALVVLQRRPWLAGLLLGLSLQSKYIALLFVPAFAVALWVQTPTMSVGRRIRRMIAPAALVLAPTALVELGALATLGARGYVEHLRETVRFVRSGGQHYEPTTVVDKLATLGESWFLPGWLVALAALGVIAVAVAAAIIAKRDPDRLDRASRTCPRELLGIAAVTGVGLLAFVGWWASASHTPLWIRHPSPALFALVPLAMAFVVLALRVLGKAALVCGSVLVAGMLGWSTAGHLAQAFTPAWEDLAQQREAAVKLADLGGERYAAAWGAPVSITVMSGAHVGLWDAGANVDDWPRLLPAWWGDQCLPPRVEIGDYAVCGPGSLP